MHEFDDLPVSLCQDNGEIFFRAADVNRFNRVFDAVVDDAQHVLMTSHYDGVIDHYGKLMLNRLKMRSGLAVETYMPASTEALVSRFNELVNQMSMEEARGEAPSSAPGRIVVVNDPKAIEADGWALLSRMISDFPGLNMRLVLLLDRIPQTVEKALDRLGSRLLRWEIEPPSATEQLALRKEAMGVGLEFQVERVLSRINQHVSEQLEPNLGDGPEDASLQIDVTEALSEGTTAGEREAEDMKALFEEEPPKKRSRGGLRLVLLTLLLLTAGTFVAGFVSPDVGRQLDRLLVIAGIEEPIFSRPDRPQSVVDAAYDTNQTVTPILPPPLEPEEGGGEPADAEPADPRTVVTEAIASEPVADVAPTGSVEPREPAPEVPTESTPAAAEIPSVASPPTSPPQPAVAADPAPEPAPAPATQSETSVATPAAPSGVQSAAVRAALENVIDANPQSQFVQHIVLGSEARAQSWLSGQANLPAALVVPIRVNNAVRYAVVSGPFPDRAATLTYIQGMGAGADYWVRTAGSLQRIVERGE
jgi:septal ring-binding cell division protein DamX